ncbi:hypothetical protein CPT_Shaeky_061 [Streptomyces phage Shaeky]|uniref:Uncharacterized protein n=1 Tax=Streptomyces phage Shaeky TaxID=2767586 RepID=A0A873WHX1_9CAUD|nr:hypothetical protein CPT_Shaeky_061 [Streptomyces phage Shaeky]
MDLYVNHRAGMHIQAEPDPDNPGEEIATLLFTAQGGMPVRVHMCEDDWRWLGAIFADKRAADDRGQ